MPFTNSKISIFALAGLLLCYSPVYADKDVHEHGKPKHEKHVGKKHGHNKHKGFDKEHSDKIIIRDSDRVIIRKYIVEDYHSHCPPGLAKKHNG
jgi:hypothetical protein